MRTLSNTIPGRQLGGAMRSRPAIRQFLLAGHSLGAGGGSSDADFDSSTRLASVLGGASEDNWASGGAILHWHNTNTALFPGNGGFAVGLAALYDRPLHNSTLNAIANSGQAVVNMASTAGLLGSSVAPYPSVISIGTGTNNEVHLVKIVNSGTQVTLAENLVNTHASGEPVFQTPGYGYTSKLPLFIPYWGVNDLATMTPTDWPKRFINPMRMLVAKARCAWVAEDNHTSFVRGPSGGGANTWNNSIALSGTNSGFNVSGNGGSGQSTGTLNVPDDYPGTAINIAFIWGSNLGTNVTVTVDGSSTGFTVNGLAQNTWDFTLAGDQRGRGLVTSAPNITPIVKNNGGVMRLEGLSAGKHTIVFSTTDTAGDIYFDWWGIESPEPPLVIMVELNRAPTWDYYSPPIKPTAGAGTNWPGAQQAVTLSAQANSGATTISVNDTSTASMYVATPLTGQLPMPNQIIRLANGGTVEYKKVHPTTAMTGTGPFVITLDSALANTFPTSGTTVTIGLQDESIRLANADLRSLANEFKDGRVAVAAVDALLNADSKYFLREGPTHWIHLNDRGQSLITAGIMEAMEKMPWPPRAAAASSTPSAPVPGPAVFHSSFTATAGGAFTIQTTGTTEWGSPVLRRRVDCRRVRECRVIGYHAATTVAGSRLRLQYSVDDGTTWNSVARAPDLSFPTGAAVADGEITATATGEKVGAWVKLPPEARRDKTMFRFVQMATAAGTPTWYWLEVQFRG